MVTEDEDVDDDNEMPLTDPMMDAIALPLGHVILDFNWLEIDTAGLLARLKGINDYERMELTRIGYTKKLKKIKKLLEKQLPKDDPTANTLRLEIQEALKEAEDLNELRNKYIHGEYWPMLDPDDTLIETRHRAHRDAGHVNMPSVINPTTLRQLASDINAMAYKMRELAARYSDRIYTEEDKG